ncbi:MAG TPA: TonB-dependent receptor [Bacteroidales bacterium]|nr:TonB-dependent receptor [Bacteroidales bacterium]HPE57385.1 TonB-dependent receptor [Bacteroidales bacterium]HRX96872.1 TonB-dependent receptor [Bacteroidales bacterium]
MRQLLIIFYLTLTASWTFAQKLHPDSIYMLPDVRVSASKIVTYSAGQKVESIDSTLISGSGNVGLGELLYRNSSLNINRYNLNGLNLLSVRGTTSSQSSVYWNGFQLNPPNNSLIDLSIIPANYFNDISILYGGSSSLYGSGNIGAGIHLNNKPVFKKLQYLSFYNSIASFHEYSGNIKAIYANPKWYFKTQVMGRKAQNDFRYKSLEGEYENFANAALRQKGFMQDVFRNFKGRNISGISLWYQENDKEIPATLTSKPADADQKDRSLRGVLSSKQFIPKGFISAKLAVFNDYEHYIDPDSLQVLEIDSEIETTRIQGEVSMNKQISKSTMFDAGVELIHLTGKSVNYAQQINQQQAGIYLLISQRFLQNKWVANLKMRQDFNTDFTMPFTPSLGLEGPVINNLKIKATVSKNFRIPTFNDLYWIPGGNSELKPETSWNQDIGLLYKTDTASRIDFYSELTAFNSMVDDWIMWIPDGALWSPLNIRRVWARGIEATAKSNVSFGKVKAGIMANYTYTRSTNEKKLYDNDPVYQKQLIYIPKHRFQLSLNLVFAYWVVGVDQSYTGERYVSADNTESMEGYLLTNMYVQKSLIFNNDRLILKAEILNLLNEEYQAVLYYPMPGRSYSISIQLIIQ